jgi:hypothetical protein
MEAKVCQKGGWGPSFLKISKPYSNQGEGRLGPPYYYWPLHILEPSLRPHYFGQSFQSPAIVIELSSRASLGARALKNALLKIQLS